ncbi:MAG: ABC transporter ATP-binding protein [Magnetococcales bacterium]|nr:ABC transporter ATP-binding protein [Magnetococcales bacterium]
MTETTSCPLIRIVGLNKQYETDAGAFPVLKEVNLEVAAGEFVAIMGPSGSGKSTFLNLLGCLDLPTSGDYWLQGREVARLDRDERAQLRNRLLGFVFQGFNLLPRMTLEENVGLPLVYARIPRQERRQRAREMLERMGLGEYFHSIPSRISGGQQQRAAIARALILRPPLILADEPTGNLDTRTSGEVMAIFQELNHEGVAVVLVTHEPDVAACARRLVRFVDGRIVHDGPATAEALAAHVQAVQRVEEREAGMGSTSG